MRSSSGRAQLAVEQLLPRAVGAVVGDAEIARRIAGARRIRRQRAGRQHGLLVERGGRAVHGADEGVAAAADHAVAQRGARSLLVLVEGGVERDVRRARSRGA